MLPILPNTLKWKDLAKPGTTLPTPWAKDSYEKASRESQARRAKLRADKRPEANCIMFTRADFFCAVCAPASR